MGPDGQQTTSQAPTCSSGQTKGKARLMESIRVWKMEPHVPRASSPPPTPQPAGPQGVDRVGGGVGLWQMDLGRWGGAPPATETLKLMKGSVVRGEKLVQNSFCTQC